MVMIMLLMMKTDVLASNDPSSGGDGPHYAGSPSRPLLDVRFFVASWCLCVSFVLIHLHGVNIFDKATSTPGGTRGTNRTTSR
jgi:hypothetical protein